MSLYALLVGGMSQMREFVKEADIYKRERLVNLRIVPYVSSKVWVALLLAFYQGLAYTVMHYLAFKMPGGSAGFVQVYITMVLATMTGMMLGLLASAIAPNAASAPLTLIMLIVPLIVLSGALAPDPTQHQPGGLHPLGLPEPARDRRRRFGYRRRSLLAAGQGSARGHEPGR